MHNKIENSENFMLNSFTVTQNIGQQRPHFHVQQKQNQLWQQLQPLSKQYNKQQQQNSHHRQMP